MVDLIFSLLELALWILDTVWNWFWFGLLLLGLLSLAGGKSGISPWQTESLDFDNMPGERDSDGDENSRA